MKIKTSLQAGGFYYTIQYGDNLSRLAQRFYGDMSYNSVMKIYWANSAAIGPNPNLIRAGQTIWIP